MTNADTNAIPIDEWLKFVDREYLSTFIKDGGASVKFAVAPDDLKPRLYDDMRSLCDERDFALIELDAATRRAHMPQDIFFGMASQIAWRELARRMTIKLAAEHGYQTDGLESTGSSSLLDAIAIANGLDPSFARLNMERAIQDEVYRDSYMARDFRVAMTQLCLMSRVDGVQTRHDDQPLLDWLTGENQRISNVRPFAIRTRIDRNAARYFIESALYWIRRAGYAGTVVMMDNTRVMLARRPRPPDGLRYYTKAMTTEHYEVLREFIDDVDRLSAALFVVVTGYEFLDEQSARGWGIYSALRTRVMDDVRDKNIVNPMAPLVRLL